MLYIQSRPSEKTSGHGLRKHNQSLNLALFEPRFPLRPFKRSEDMSHFSEMRQLFFTLLRSFFHRLIKNRTPPPPKKKVWGLNNISTLASLGQKRFPFGNICFGRQPCPAHNTGNYGSYLNRRDLLTGNASFRGMKEPGNESFIDAPRGLEKEYPHAL